VQRAAVRRLLAERDDVLLFADAPPEWGGWGATVVKLR
jgi:DNA-nicking Smr family endonuclease